MVAAITTTAHQRRNACLLNGLNADHSPLTRNPVQQGTKNTVIPGETRCKMGVMSSHYIYVRCGIEGCTTSGTIYTGDEIVEGFLNDSWEGETITATCDDCTEATK